jgi:GMP synthase-like glutamine amidotransferase
MAATDSLPWIAQELAMIREADRIGVPVAGHCLGSQLIATALGGSARPHHCRELGWGSIRTSNTPRGVEWWGPYAGNDVETFQWHGDSFAGPDAADVIASSAFCQNQVAIVGNRHMLIQSHLEITPALIELTLNKNFPQLDRELRHRNPAAQPAAAILTNLAERTEGMHGVLHQLYTRWVQGCN